ncbi:MAG: hypothetical protein ACFFFC_12540 [Candidatus Thorarchaeota archaeon]
MSRRATVTLEWLRKGRPIDDSTIIGYLMLDTDKTEIAAKLKRLEGKRGEKSYRDSLTKWQSNIALIPSLFEREFNLPQVQEEPMEYKEINDTLRCSVVHQEVSRLDSPLTPTGMSLEDQINSLLPTCLEKTLSKRSKKKEYMTEKKESLVYFLSRLAMDSMPSLRGWPLVPTGLNGLSAALFTLHFISQAARTQIPWLALIWKYEIERYRNELLLDLLGSLTHQITVREARAKIEQMSKEIRKDLGARDPIVVWAHEWEDRLKEFIPKMKLVDCEVTEEKSKNTPEDELEEESEEDEVSDLRRKLREEIELRIPRSGAAQTPQTPLPRSIWTQLSISADSPLPYMFQELLSSFRAELNVMRFRQLVNTCEYLSDIEKPGKPSRREIADASNVGVRSAKAKSIGLTLTERYIPAWMDMGLRCRYIFTRLQKSALDSPGLAERIFISESDAYQVVTKHVEPIASHGPQGIVLPDEYYQTTVDTDLVSMRMNLFDDELGEWREWVKESSTQDNEEAKPSGKDAISSRGTKKTKQRLLRKTSASVKEYTMLTQREIDLLSLIGSVTTNAEGMRWLLNSVKFPSRTSEYLLSKLLRTKRLRLLYHPTLHYAGLPEGLLVAAEFKAVKRLNRFIERLASFFPFVHSQFSTTEKSVVSIVRAPRFSNAGVFIKEELQDEKALRAIGTIAHNRTYHMSVLHRLYQSKNKPWRDPWVHSEPLL